MAKLVTVSLFSGCGGSDLGAKRAGADIVFANDIKLEAVQTYRKHKDLLAAPDAVVRHADVTVLRSVPECDLLIGCYPCQSFSMGGKRAPASDPSSSLFKEFIRCLTISQAKYFVAENVPGLLWLEEGAYLEAQLKEFRKAGRGYLVTWAMLNAKDYGVPAERRRIFIVGVRRDLDAHYRFPGPTHGTHECRSRPWASHGDAISQLPLHPDGEFYTRENEEFPWWYMSRNRKRQWGEPSYAIIGNWRHVPLHPASPVMEMVESDLSNGSKQRWEFTSRYDHLDGSAERRVLEKPRRLSWRECAALQTFPPEFEPTGNVQSKYWQIGNAVPPLLMEVIARGLTEGTRLVPGGPPDGEVSPAARKRKRTKPHHLAS